MSLFFKILITIVLYTLSNCVYGQLIIGKELPSNDHVLLEFGPDNKGLILPTVEDAPQAVGGTMIFHKEEKSVMVLEEKNNGLAQNWTNLTHNEEEGTVHNFLNSGPDIIDENTGVILGSTSSLKPGILVLESTEKVLVLPKVFEAHNALIAPVAGTILYDESCDMLAVFDGTNWSYWN